MSEWQNDDPQIPAIFKNAAILGWAVASLAGLAAILSSAVYIPAGFEGVKFNVLTGHVAGVTLKQGW